MDEKAVIEILGELVKETGAEGLSEVKKFAKNRDILQELLDYFRICIKYQVFDLEATRRENELLKGENKELMIRLTAIGGTE